MALSLRRWRPRHLMLAWIAYWLTLLVVVLPRPIMIARRLAQLPEGQGNISVELGTSGFKLTMMRQGTVEYAASMSVTALLLWILGPPLVLWLIWFAQARRPAAIAAEQ